MNVSKIDFDKLEEMGFKKREYQGGCKDRLDVCWELKSSMFTISVNWYKEVFLERNDVDGEGLRQYVQNMEGVQDIVDFIADNEGL